MTLLSKNDGDDASYLDIANIIKALGTNINKDLLELYKRMIFNVAISNSDDHLRNHSFIICKNVYELSPLYDINPIPYGNELSLCINKYDKNMSKELLKEVSPFFNIDNKKADNLIEDIFNVVSNNWENKCQKYLINRNQIEMIRPAFSIN